MKKGFTLIELSIVLVIIGFLIGGILVTQSMVGTAKNQKLLQTMQQYMIAGRNFKTTYRFWPGDYPRPDFGCSGNGNGAVEFHSSGPPGCNIGGQNNYEGSNYFVHLALADFTNDKIDYNLTLDSSKIFVPSVNVPVGLEGNSMFVAQSTLGLWNGEARCIGFCNARTAPETPAGVSYLFYSGAQGNSYPNDSRHLVNIIKPQDAHYSDVKVDDGMPNSGNVIGTLADQAVGGPYSPCGGSGNPYLAAQFQLDQPYNLTNADKVCILGFKFSEDFN